MLHAAVTPCFFVLILVTFIYYRYYTHLFIYILYIYFLFLSFFPFGPPSTHWVVPRALFIKLVKRSCPVPVTDTFSWVSFSLAVGALYKLYYYYYYYLVFLELLVKKSGQNIKNPRRSSLTVAVPTCTFCAIWYF